MPHELNEAEAEMLRYGLGLDRSKSPKRNFILANDRGRRRPVLLGLAARGLVVEGERIGQASRAFRVTVEGAKAIGLKRLKPEFRVEAPEAPRIAA